MLSFMNVGYATPKRDLASLDSYKKAIAASTPVCMKMNYIGFD